MKLQKIIDKLGLEVAADAGGLDREVETCYASDLLSDVMANAAADSLWVTVQTHANVSAVCSLNDLAGVIIVKGKRPSEETLAKAREEGVTILLTQQSTFDIVGELYQLGIRGNRS
jgi:serine kinase of HPr protein (carbohydrate metabolism regulator)